MGGIRGRCVLCLALPDTWALGQVRCSEAAYNLGPSPQKEAQGRRARFCVSAFAPWGTEAGGGGLSRRTPCLAGVEGSAPLPGPSPFPAPRVPVPPRRPQRLWPCRRATRVRFPRLGATVLASGPPSSRAASPRGHRPPVRPSASHTRRDPASPFQTRSRAQAPGPGLERVSGGQFGP